ncbi:Glyoxal_oxid_N domain-containing protein/DUF1929 domain-containing protein [Cephalotus follicularis]|uniref:Glyoxal_oxid_N domain-containing protein/DUF1929 domain-containing protein n=1 Tax=Cephalotus follicularis TaxID=3775 RepID=A0A1Q3B8D7_CEPFO|nr:Glyoxal_oxid_N domain-containing protein/DUF1929 domain-containing protein [Cephalotus follicularis]
MINFLLLSLSFSIYHSLISSQSLLPFGSSQGEWQLLHASIGISPMHMQVLHNNKVIMFDRTDFGLSNLSLPGGRCRHDANDTALETDCTAHSVLYDIDTNSFRPLMVQTDTWCSSGSVLPDGTLVQTGGYNDGDRVVRTFNPCMNDDCDWVEFPQYLSRRRWYSSNQILPDGRVIIVGGRGQFNYEFYPRSIESSSFSLFFSFNFLRDTADEYENNLYPFLHLLPDGNLFIFANTRSLSFDYNQNRVVREFPPIIDGNPRNYPSSGSSVLLPLDEFKGIEPEILVCGGAPKGSYYQATHGVFISGSSTCGRLKVGQENPSWVMEQMPIPRVMGDMILLPNGDVIIINGAELGAAGWENGRGPITRPVLYRTYTERIDWRFSVLSASPRPRMYHSSVVLVPDGRVIVGGSNPHVYYNFTNVEYPTDLSLEAFNPPYLSAEYAPIRPRILSFDNNIGYGKTFSVRFTVQQYSTERFLLSIRIVAPSFTTHSFAMNQRMVVLKMNSNSNIAGIPSTYEVSVLGPSTAQIAPPGYYMLFVVHANIPSPGVWVKIG